MPGLVLSFLPNGKKMLNLPCTSTGYVFIRIEIIKVKILLLRNIISQISTYTVPESYLLRTKSVVSPYRGTSDRRMYGASTVQIRFGYDADMILIQSVHGIGVVTVFRDCISFLS